MTVKTTTSNEVTIHSQLTHADIASCLAVIKSLHPSWKDDEPELTIKLWHNALKDFPLSAVKKAVLQVSTNSKYTPKLANVISTVTFILQTEAQYQFDVVGDDVDIEEIRREMMRRYPKNNNHEGGE